MSKATFTGRGMLRRYCAITIEGRFCIDIFTTLHLAQRAFRKDSWDTFEWRSAVDCIKNSFQHSLGSWIKGVCMRSNGLTLCCATVRSSFTKPTAGFKYRFIYRFRNSNNHFSFSCVPQKPIKVAWKLLSRKLNRALRALSRKIKWSLRFDSRLSDSPSAIRALFETQFLPPPLFSISWRTGLGNWNQSNPAAETFEHAWANIINNFHISAYESLDGLGMKQMKKFN